MMKKERGAITLFTVVICMFLLANVLLINVGVMNKNASQERETAKINENYEVSQAKMEQAYQEAIESNEYPTYGELLQLLEKVKEDAKKEAQTMVDQAKKNAEDLVNQAKKNAEDLVNQATADMNEKVKQEKLKMYPVGSLYISTSSTNPSEFIGGTWERYGKGQTLVGLDENQSEFNTVGKTGGQKNITLSVAQLPSHNHSIPILSGTTAKDGGHTHSYSKSTSIGGTAINEAQLPSHIHKVTPDIKLDISFQGSRVQTESSGSHRHSFSVLGSPNFAIGAPAAASGVQGWTALNVPYNTETAGAHTHYVTTAGTITKKLTINESKTTSVGSGQTHSHSIGYTPTATDSEGGHTHKLTTEANTTGTTGSGQAVNVQDPYITVYMWRRTS